MKSEHNNAPTPSEGTIPTEAREEIPFNKWLQNFFNNIDLHPSLEIEFITINIDDIDDCN